MWANMIDLVSVLAVGRLTSGARPVGVRLIDQNLHTRLFALWKKNQILTFLSSDSNISWFVLKTVDLYFCENIKLNLPRILLYFSLLSCKVAQFGTLLPSWEEGFGILLSTWLPLRFEALTEFFKEVLRLETLQGKSGTHLIGNSILILPPLYIRGYLWGEKNNNFILKIISHDSQSAFHIQKQIQIEEENRAYIFFN